MPTSTQRLGVRRLDATPADAPIADCRSNYRFHIAGEDDDPRWDAFLAATPGGSYLQSSLWARAKAGQGWRALRLLACDERGAIRGGAQLLLRRLPLGGSVAFVYKGPVASEPGLAEQILEEIFRILPDLRVHYLTIQPPAGGESLVTPLLSRGCRPGPLSGWGHVPATTAVDLTLDVDQIIKRMRKTARSRLRRAERMGVTVREGAEGDLPTFYRLLVSTGQRKDFPTNSEGFYRAFWRSFSPGGHMRIFIAEYEGEPVSAMLAICFGGTVTYWKAAWSGQHDDKEPNMRLQWHVINWAKAHGYARYDFLGLDSDHTLAWALATGRATLDTLANSSSFKLGFGGDILTSPVAYEYLPNPIVRRVCSFARDHQAIWRLINALAPRVRRMARRR